MVSGKQRIITVLGTGSCYRYPPFTVLFYVCYIQFPPLRCFICSIKLFYIVCYIKLSFYLSVVQLIMSEIAVLTFWTICTR